MLDGMSMLLPIVPHGYTTNLPFPADVVIVRRMDMVLKEVQKLVGFRLLQFSKSDDEAAIHIQRFQSRDRMCSDSRMVSVDRRAVRRGTP